MLTEILQSAIYRGDLVLTLEKIVKAYFKFAQSNTTFYRMQLAMYFAPRKVKQTRQFIPLQWNKGAFGRCFCRAAEDHSNLRGRQHRYAVGFLGEINAMIGLSLNRELKLSDELAFQLVHQFMHGIFS